MSVRKVTALSEAAATDVSTPICVRYAKKVTFCFERTSHAGGSGIFSIQASVAGKDGGNFIPYVNMISNDVNNHSQTLERSRTVELTADSKLMTALDLDNFCYDYIQVKVVESGSGKNTVKCLIQE